MSVRRAQPSRSPSSMLQATYQLPHGLHGDSATPGSGYCLRVGFCGRSITPVDGKYERLAHAELKRRRVACARVARQRQTVPVYVGVGRERRAYVLLLIGSMSASVLTKIREDVMDIPQNYLNKYYCI